MKNKKKKQKNINIDEQKHVKNDADKSGSKPKKKPKKQALKNGIKKFLIALIFIIVSLGLILYPYISNYIFENRADGIIDTIEKTAEDADKEQYAQQIQDAIEYNEYLVNGHIQIKDPFNEDVIKKDEKRYNSLLNMTEEGVMGFIKIPCIDVSLPIYHGTSERVLELGAGHLQGTSLPVGGTGSHSAITGHTGLSSAKMFTDLTELENGDLFFVHVLGEQLAYKVDNIAVVTPSDMSKLEIEKGKDYCTLITCTPYGINTHRLLVRGIRTDYKEAIKKPENFEKKKTQSKWQLEYTKSIIISAIFFMICILSLILYRYIEEAKEAKRKKRRKNKKKKIKSKTS